MHEQSCRYIPGGCILYIITVLAPLTSYCQQQAVVGWGASSSGPCTSLPSCCGSERWGSAPGWPGAGADVGQTGCFWPSDPRASAGHRPGPRDSPSTQSHLYTQRKGQRQYKHNGTIKTSKNMIIILYFECKEQVLQKYLYWPLACCYLNSVIMMSPSCIVGNIGIRLWKGRRRHLTEKLMSLVQLHQIWSYDFKTV